MKKLIDPIKKLITQILVMLIRKPTNLKILYRRPGKSLLNPVFVKVRFLGRKKT
jgi:hypothetical protein